MLVGCRKEWSCKLWVSLVHVFAGLTAFGDVLAPKVAPSPDMLDSEFVGLDGAETGASAEEQDTRRLQQL